MRVSAENYLLCLEVHLPLDFPGPVSTHMRQINAEERAVRCERGHRKSAIADEITFSDLYHAAEFCDTLPLLKQVSKTGLL
jgi:hypothetical protein